MSTSADLPTKKFLDSDGLEWYTKQIKQYFTKEKSYSDALPIGTLQPFLGTTAPQGYLFCQGQLLDKTKYPELYSICGDLFGESTATQFYLPDLRGRVVAGYDENNSNFNTIGKLLGEEAHTLLLDEIPTHNHGIATQGGSDMYSGYSYGNGGYFNTAFMDAVGGGQAHNNIQPTVVLNWIVKAYVLLPTDYLINGYDNIPVGSYIEYHGDSIPSGYEEINNGLSERVQELERKLVYSFKESQVGVWLDGTKIYRKVIPLTISSSPTEIDVNTYNIGKLIRIEGQIENSARNIFLPFYEGTNSYIFIYYDKTNEKIKIEFSGSWSAYSGYIIIEYTKNEEV